MHSCWSSWSTIRTVGKAAYAFRLVVMVNYPNSSKANDQGVRSIPIVFKVKPSAISVCKNGCMAEVAAYAHTTPQGQ